MQLYAYSLFDNKAMFFSPPFFMQADGLAIRAVIELVTDMNTQVGRHPHDFVLFRVGSFDNNNGVMVTDVPVNLGVAASFLPKHPNSFVDEFLGRQSPAPLEAKPNGYNPGEIPA